MSRKLSLWIIPAIAALTSCSNSTSVGSEAAKAEKPAETDKDKEKKEEKIIRVRVAPMKRGEIASVIETTSNVEAESTVDVFPKVGGIIAKIHVEEGDLVEFDQALARIDDRELKIRESQAKVAFDEAKQQAKQSELAVEETAHRERIARNSADQAKKDFERNQNLAAESAQGKTSLISQKDLEASKLTWNKAEGDWAVAKFAAAKADIDAGSAKISAEKAQLAWDLAKLQLQDCEIRARSRGVVSFRGVRAGETATQSTRAFTIVDLDHLITNFYRPQKELRFLAANVPIEAICEAFPEKTFSGTVLRVNPVVDPASGTFKVTARIENPERLLRSGMLVRTRITTAKHPDAFLIPKKAIFYEGDKPVIFALREGLAVRVPLEAGFSNLETIEALNVGGGDGKGSGLHPEDRIIVVGNAELRDGAKVEVVDG